MRSLQRKTDKPKRGRNTKRLLPAVFAVCACICVFISVRFSHLAGISLHIQSLSTSWPIKDNARPALHFRDNTLPFFSGLGRHRALVMLGLGQWLHGGSADCPCVLNFISFLQMRDRPEPQSRGALPGLGPRCVGGNYNNDQNNNLQCGLSEAAHFHVKNIYLFSVWKRGGRAVEM